MDPGVVAALEEAGLTVLESKVYVTLVENGPLLAGELSRKAGVHRRLAYDAAERLSAKGLIGQVTRNNRRWFEAVPPARILELLDERKQRLASTVTALQQRWGVAQQRQQTLVFEGIAGLKSVFEDQLSVGKEILIVSPGYTDSMRHYFHWYDQRRKSSKVPVRLLFPAALRDKTPTIPLSKARFLPQAAVGPAAFNVYGDTVALILWTEKPVAILIRDKDMAKSYRAFFELLWSAGKA